MKIVFFILVAVMMSSCASHHKDCQSNQEWSKDELQQRQHFFEPAGTWRR